MSVTTPARTTGSLPHEEGYENAVNAINVAVQRSLGARGQYTKAAVLAMYW